MYRLYSINGFTDKSGHTYESDLLALLKMGDVDPVFTLELFEDDRICLTTSDFEMKDIQQMIENGSGIFPFSKTIPIEEVVSYANIGIKPYFMKIADYRKFKADYEESLCITIDDRQKALF
ncbi:MAG: hypothetical protein IKS48_00230 [Eubacterium sp.]|nr:hypothetical protein [Eubacterium sp.]